MALPKSSGDDHVNNTQADLLYEALGYAVPSSACPMIWRRQGETEQTPRGKSVMAYKEMGICGGSVNYW